MINVTLILQIVNFLFAYFVLKKLFFVPVITIIEQDQETNRKLHDNIAESLARINEQEQKKEELWQVCRDNLGKKIPVVHEEHLFVFRHIKPDLSVPLLDEAAERQLEKEVAEAIVNTVSYVHD